jgi:hypothetical protein
MATGQQHKNPYQYELASDEQSPSPDVPRRWAVCVRSCVIHGLAHLIGSLRHG